MADNDTVRIETVLCPVDFSALSDPELAVAVELCEAFGARLVLHHNLDLAPPAWSKAWEWEETHPPEEDVEKRAEEQMQELLGRIPGSVPAEATISKGLVVPVLLHLVDQLPAHLLVLGSHGWSTEEHASVADRIIECCPCPVLTIREGGEDARRFRLCTVDGYDLCRVLVPTDFTKSGDRAVAYACDLARRLPLRLHLLHVLSSGGGGEVEGARRKLEQRVPPDLVERIDCSVETGPVADTLVAFAARHEPRLIVMGRHARGLLQRFFTHDHAQEVLHRAGCPVWFAA